MAPAIYPARAPALAIAAFIRRAGGAAYSGEILSAFGISQPTLRRRRAALRRLGIVFIENGSGSLYAMEELAPTVVESLARPRRRRANRMSLTHGAGPSSGL
jgi:hypothetical protein